MSPVGTLSLARYGAAPSRRNAQSPANAIARAAAPIDGQLNLFEGDEK